MTSLFPYAILNSALIFNSPLLNFNKLIKKKKEKNLLKRCLNKL